jgi:hypothetical protein
MNHIRHNDYSGFASYLFLGVTSTQRQPKPVKAHQNPATIGARHTDTHKKSIIIVIVEILDYFNFFIAAKRYASITCSIIKYHYFILKTTKATILHKIATFLYYSPAHRQHRCQ